MTIACATVTLMLVASRAGAQQREEGADTRRAYLEASLLGTTWPEGPPDYHYTRLLGGTTVVVDGAIGFFIVPRISIGADVSVGSLSGIVEFNHFAHFTELATYTEILCAAFVRAHLPAGRLRLEPTFTLGFAHESKNFTQGVQLHDTIYPPRPPESLPDQSYGDFSLALGGGLDVAVPVSESLAVVGSFRLLQVRRHEDVASPGFTGMGDRSIQFGGGVRWTFR